ncbi:MAG: hypothetical protein ABSC03_02900 [Verrucomicrobiota bacterium]|jgi:hypothetical protein
MPEPDLIELFAQPLNQLGVRYLVSGSVAAMLYGEPRVTHDIDLVVLLRSEDVPRLAEVFPAPEFYVPPASVIAAEMSRDLRGHFNLVHIGSGLKADFYLASRDELHAWAFRHTRRYAIGEISIALAPPEYVILRKLEYYREGGSEKHRRDIRAMLAISGDQIDRPAVAEWIQRRGLETEWRRVTD